MSDSHPSRERQALAALLELARGKSARELQEWLEYLRVEGPTVAARLERLLADGGGRGSGGDSAVGAGDDFSRDDFSRDDAAEGGARPCGAPGGPANGTRSSATDSADAGGDFVLPPTSSHAAHGPVIPLPHPPRADDTTRGGSAHERPERKRYVAPALSYGLLVR